jgi:XTP/dITP diphosphohydrolase
MPERTLYFATGNRAKLAQLRWVAHYLGCAVCVCSARERFGDAARYDEIGDTEFEIASTGARAVANRIGAPVVTEDTGLHVAALNGRPGVRAGLYLKTRGRAGLLCELATCGDRHAEIVAVTAYAAPDGACVTYEHRVRGQVIDEDRWVPGLPEWIAPTEGNASGGGYNAVFVPDGETRTLAEIPPVEALDLGYREPNFAALLQGLGLVPL